MYSICAVYTINGICNTGSNVRWVDIVYSAGGHGDYPELIARLDPLFRRYRVSLYLCGHDHALNVELPRQTAFPYIC